MAVTWRTVAAGSFPAWEQGWGLAADSRGTCWCWQREAALVANQMLCALLVLKMPGTGAEPPAPLLGAEQSQPWAQRGG